MTEAHRLILMLYAAALWSFVLFGSAIPGFSGTTSRILTGVGAAAVTLVVVFGVYLPRRVLFSAFMAAITVMVARGSLAWLLGGPERTGVFFLYYGAAVSMALTYERMRRT